MVAVSLGLLGEFRVAPVRLLGVVVALESALALLVGAVLSVVGAIATVVLTVLAVAGLAGTQVTISWTDLAGSQVRQLVIAALEPPTDGQPVDANDRDE